MKSRNKDYEIIGRWVTPTVCWAPCFRWNQSKMFESFGFCSEGDSLVLDGYWLSHKSCRETIEKALKEPLQENDFQMIEECIKKATDYFDLFLKFKKELDNYKERPLIDITEDFFKRYTELEVPWITCFNVAGALEKRLMELAKREGYSEDEVGILLHPRRLTFSMEQKAEMNDIRKELVEENLIEELDNLSDFKKDYPTIFEKMQVHVKKYEWLGTLHFWGDGFGITELAERLKEEDKLFEKKEVDFPRDFRRLIDLGCELVWIRQQAPDVAALMSYAARPLLRDVAKEFRIDYEDLIWMIPDEIISHLKEKTFPDKDELQERKKGCGIIIENNKLKVISGEELKKEIDKWMINEVISTNVIKGTVANKGRVTGKVKIMHDPFSKKFEKGEILVTSETTPDFLPVMIKAAAFITNIGGITSHAAVTAREMGKPCIINTKEATSVFKDGDIVEVDADKGIVRKIK